MTEQIDSRTGATLAIHLYGTAYGPASQYFTHVSGSALLRRVTADYRYSTKPVNSWARRAPVRLTDACVGLLAGALANQTAEPAELFVRHGEGHAQRVLPPLLVTIGKGMVRRLCLADLVSLLKQVREMCVYLSRVGPDDAPDEREASVRAMYEDLIARLHSGDILDDVIRPVVDYFVTRVLAEWDAERTDQLRQVHEPGGA